MNSLICADDITLMSEGKEELQSLLMKVKESEKAGLKLKNKQTNKKKNKIMAFGPITSWQIDQEKCRNSGGYYFLGLHNHCRW